MKVHELISRLTDLGPYYLNDEVVFRVPGGGDYSNTELSVDEVRALEDGVILETF